MDAVTLSGSTAQQQLPPPTQQQLTCPSRSPAAQPFVLVQGTQFMPISARTNRQNLSSRCVAVGGSSLE